MKSHSFKLTILILLFIGIRDSHAQTITQSVKGKVVDKISQESLPGASIFIMSSNSTEATTTDVNGDFEFKLIPVGKYNIKVNFIGYKESIIPNISVNAGKETVLNILLEENINEMKEIVVTGKVEKNKPLNEMSMVSTRTFSVEETQKFAAAVNDPARMATSFAGVVQGGDGNNHISIRGNAPNGLLWRLEGVEIPNPNHFSSVSTSGGGISILSAQLLGNSDFSTGAFASEYGNALSGVFDLKLRKGNNTKKEYTFQAGVLGIDAAMEGPFRKGKSASYLANYRYSTLGLLSKMGVPIGDGETVFQDLSFNIHLPTSKFGNFSVFGFGGISTQMIGSKKDSTLWKDDLSLKYSSSFYSNTGAIGVTNTKLFQNQSYLKTVLVSSLTQNGSSVDQLDNSYIETRQSEEKFNQQKITLSTTYTQKLSARHNYRTGLIINELIFNLNEKYLYTNEGLTTRIKVKGSSQTIQSFFQWNSKIGNKLTMNVGMHYMQFLLNGSKSLEPRASIKYDINERENITFGYGLHSQLQPLGIYFAEIKNTNGIKEQPNKNLGFSKAHHFVLGHDININDYSHIKTEIYLQQLYNIPISVDTNNRFSMLNVFGGYETSKLANNGLGRNYGIELTYERFMHNNLYYIFSSSIYESKFKASNGNWYNTMFNTNHSSTFTLGKEWTLSEKSKSRVIGANIKIVHVGGWRYTPINLSESIKKGETAFDDSKTFESQNPYYLRADVRISIKRNYKKATTTLALDIQNVSNRKNVGGQYFDITTKDIKYWYQAPLIPILSYKVEF